MTVVVTSNGHSPNLAMLAEYSDRMEAGDWDAVYRFWDDDFVTHVTDRVNPDLAGTDVRGHEVAYWKEARAAFPDMVFRVDLLIEAEDLVVSNWTIEGTHTGAPFYDVAPSGEKVVINGTAVLRIRDGKIVEHWGGPHCQNGVGLVAGASPAVVASSAPAG
jgi:predicted ester cyclase